jgi:hypothetical protein
VSVNLRQVAERVLPESVKGKVGPALGRSMDRLRVPPPGLKAGRAPGAAGTGSPAAVVLLLGGVDAATVAGTVAALLRVAGAAGVRPVLVLDGPHFAPARRAGLAVDHLLSAGDWQQRHPGQPYAGYLAERLAQLRVDYATSHLVTLPPGGADALGDSALAAALTPPEPGRGRRVWQRLAGRLEAAIDRPTSGA